jgi:hypothetical protein
MSQGFRRHGRRERTGPWVPASQKLERHSSVPTGQDWQSVGCTKGPLCLGAVSGGATARAVSPARKALTLVSRTDGHGAASLPDLEIPQEFVRKAVFRQTPRASVSILP